MHILYVTRDFFSENDFPLLREFQRQGINVDVYIFGGSKSAGIIEIPKNSVKYGLRNASDFPELKARYNNYLNLQNVNFVSLKNKKIWFLYDLIIIISLFFKLKYKYYDVMHLTWPFGSRKERILYKLPIKKLWIVHDPIPHSGQEQQERNRKYAFANCKDYVLLSQALAGEFASKYNISFSHIHFNKMGEFDYLREMTPTLRLVDKKYILFFGQIVPHKGVEYLMEAMLEVHKRHPELVLVVAGKGNIYFDMKPYEDLDYIKNMFRFIGIQEMVNLFKGAEFVVCPYKDATQSGVVQTSFSMNIPVLGTDVGALPQTIQDGVTGKIVPPSNSHALAEAIIEMMDHPEEVEHMRENIDLYWRPTMSWKDIVHDYLRIYNSL